MAVTVACQGVMEPHGIHRRKWSRVVAVTMACQEAQAYQPKFGWSSVSVETRTGIIYRGVSAKTARGSSSFAAVTQSGSLAVEAQSSALVGIQGEVYLQQEFRMKVWLP